MIIGISGKIKSGKDTVGKIIQYLVDKNKAGYQHSDSQEDFESYCKNFNQKYCNWQIKKFAGKLKEITALLTGCTVEDLESQEFKNKELGIEWRQAGWKIRGFIQAAPEESVTYRHLLQVIGTNALRDVVHKNIWVNALFADYYLRQKPPQITEKGAIFSFDGIYPNWVITDMRFPNEFDAVKSREGITIRVNRPTKDLFCNNVNAQLPLTIMTQHPSETAIDNHNFDYVIDNDGSISDLIDKVKEILIKSEII